MKLSAAHRGFTLLEVLVSLGLITVLLLGLDAAQADVLKQARVGENTDKAHVMVSAYTAYQFAHRPEAVESLPDVWQAAVAASLPQGNAALGHDELSPLVVAFGGIVASQCSPASPGISGCIAIPV